MVVGGTLDVSKAAGAAVEARVRLVRGADAKDGYEVHRFAEMWEDSRRG
jgi:hypothetical protein